MKNSWIDVDKEGLAKLMEGKGKFFVIKELVQNALDEDGVSAVGVGLEPIPNSPKAKLIVFDDAPEGFHDIAHAYTMFAESKKKDNPEQRGRFNIGEKLVLALCEEAKIKTTKGTVLFEKNGKRRLMKSQKTEEGSSFSAIIRMTREEYDEVCFQINTILRPKGIAVTFNGDLVPYREPVVSFETTLSTEVADENGIMRKSARKTKVNVHEVVGDEEAMVYEMGIPVVETGDKYHIDIQQKVPLNKDRDNITPSYLQTLRTEVFNHTYDLIEEDEATDRWVQSATEDERCEEEAFKSAITHRFGTKRVAYDPTDLEANNIATAKGFKVVHGGSLSGGAWDNAKSSGAIKPAGQVTPSPKPYHENGDELKTIPVTEWTEDMARVATFARFLASNVISRTINVKIANEITWPFSATYGPSGTLVLNVGRLGHKWFGSFPDNREKVLDLLIHEFAHQYESNHLSEGFYDACTLIGARATLLALEKPEEFRVAMGATTEKSHT